MSLLLLFSDQIAAAASGDVVTTMLVETTTGVWYDATSDLISGTVVRGRQDQLDQYQAGTAEVLLDNDDRKYDPTYASSPLNGYIRPMTRVQLRDTYGGITYPLFAGSADRWTQNRDGPHRGTTSLAATDGFKNLERARLPVSVYYLEVLADNPSFWYRLDEPDGSAVVRAQSTGPDLAAFGVGAGLGGDSLITRDPGGSYEGADTTSGFSATGAFIAAGFTSLTLEAVFKSTAAVDSTIVSVSDPGEGQRFELYLSSTGVAVFKWGKTVAGNVQAANTSGVTQVDDGNPHHVVGVFDATTGATYLYVDGALEAGPGLQATVATGSLQELCIGNIAAGFSSPAQHTQGIVGNVDEVALYAGVLSAGRIAAHATARSTPWTGDLPGARINRVLDAIDWPTLERDIDTGATTLQSAELDMSALEHVQKVSDTEFGNLYVTAGGVVRFEDRAAGVNQPVLYAFADAAGVDKPITFSNPEISDEQIRNDVTVSRLDGAAQNARDATSIATYQTMSYVRDGLYNSDDAHSRQLAQFILAGYKDPVERVTNMVVNPYRDPANLWPAVLGLELTDRITLAETPQWVTPAVTRTLVVEGITHTFGPKSWTASFNVSENTTATQAYWQLGVTGFSELGQTTRLFF